MDGKLVGNTGDVAIYAFNISKIITCVFGGALTFQDKDLAKKNKKLARQKFQKSQYYQVY